MTHYIDKAAVVAEIDRLYLQHSSREYIDEAGCVLNELEDFIDTLETKEVDLEKALVVYHNENFSPCNDGTLISCETGSFLTWNDYESIAKHFFELGLKARK